MRVTEAGEGINPLGAKQIDLHSAIATTIVDASAQIPAISKQADIT